MVVPKGWKKSAISDISEISRGGSPRPIDDFLTNSFEGVNWIKIGDTNESKKYIYSTHEKITLEGALRSRKVFKGDFLLSNSMSFGRPYILKIDGCIHDGWLVIQNYARNLDIEFLYYLLCSEQILRQYNEKAAGSGVQNLNKELVSSIEIIYPTLDEQLRISDALSDIDELIVSLKELIEKKKAIKHGTIQELLTGKKRLSGYTADWLEKPLEELFDFSGGLSASRDMLSTIGYCYLHYGDIHSAHKTYIDINKDYHAIPKLNIDLRKVSNSSLLSDGDVVFVDASEDDEGASRHVIIRNNQGLPFLAGLHTIVAKDKSKELSHLFREYCFQTKQIKDQFKYFAAGTKVTGISKTNIAKIKLKFPADMAEQQAIATILSDMDNEIETLTYKMEKCRQIKQGMMQELLTGRIRLVDTASKKQRKEKIVSRAKPTVQLQGHNGHFHEAVILSTVVSLFASDKYPLGRFRRQKLAYLLHRHAQESTQGFLKKAAGPYNPTIRYKDEKIALKAGYVADRGKGKFVKGEKTNEAVNYFTQWYGAESIEWLKQFQFRKNDELEVLTTVAEAIADLKRNSLTITVESIKQVIQSNSEWRPKLDKPYFNDINIQLAMRESQKLFA